MMALHRDTALPLPDARPLEEASRTPPAGPRMSLPASPSQEAAAHVGENKARARRRETRPAAAWHLSGTITHPPDPFMALVKPPSAWMPPG